MHINSLFSIPFSGTGASSPARNFTEVVWGPKRYWGWKSRKTFDCVESFLTRNRLYYMSWNPWRYLNNTRKAAEWLKQRRVFLSYLSRKWDYRRKLAFLLQWAILPPNMLLLSVLSELNNSTRVGFPTLSLLTVLRCYLCSGCCGWSIETSCSHDSKVFFAWFPLCYHQFHRCQLII